MALHLEIFHTPSWLCPLHQKRTDHRQDQVHVVLKQGSDCGSCLFFWAWHYDFFGTWLLYVIVVSTSASCCCLWVHVCWKAFSSHYKILWCSTICCNRCLNNVWWRFPLSSQFCWCICRNSIINNFYQWFCMGEVVTTDGGWWFSWNIISGGNHLVTSNGISEVRLCWSVLVFFSD